MKNLCLTSIFCICASITPVLAADKVAKAPQNVCAEFIYEPRLNLTTSYGKLKYNFEYDQKSLTQMGKQYGLVEKGMLASGLSLIGVDWSVALNTVSRVAKDDSVCILPMSLDVYIGFRNPTIYMDKNLKKGSCQYNQTLRHEHHHQEVSVATLEHFLPLIRQEIEKNLKKVAPQNIVSLSQSDDVTDEMNEAYIALIAPMVDRFKATLMHEHQKLDNRQNYDFEHNICKNYQAKQNKK